MVNAILYVISGLAAGIFSGLFGIGGGLILIPIMVFFFGLTQHQAQGTTLALMVPPIGLLAAWAYYKHGYVNLKMALFICLGFFIGGLLGANIGTGMESATLRKIFGVALLIASIKMIFFK